MKTVIRLTLLLAAIALNLVYCAAATPSTDKVSPEPANGGVENPARFVLDKACGNPGEPPIKSAFNDPKRLADWGYNGQVVDDQLEGITTFDTLAPDLIPANSKERQWADERTKTLANKIRTAHLAGEKFYAWMQVLVLPKAVIAKFKDQICDPQGRIDIHLPKTQELFRSQLREIFAKLPDLDGLIIRTGEIYLYDLPYHAASGSGNGGLLQASTIILRGPQSHIDLLSILRDEVCVRASKLVFYRTWDFGNHFHVNPAYYLEVTNAIEPHPNLIFSIKHQAGDFQRLTPFNPTIGIGKHRQIIEVQCQLEAYGKGAYPYYVAQGVIDGWEEYAWMEKPGQNRGLRDVMSNPLVAGVWTWSRGGGWDGPYITSEFWCELNAYVVAKYAEDPTRTEAAIFEEYEHKLGLKGEDIARFRELSLLSAQAVLRGQTTTLGANIDLWWARDDTFSAPNLSDFIKKGLVDKALAEKHQAVEMWKRIEQLSQQITFADQATKDFVVTSATYGRIKYAIVEQAWTVILEGQTGADARPADRTKLSAAIAEYDRLWKEWKTLKATHPACSTLPKDLARGNKPGMGAAVDHYRRLVADGDKAGTTQPVR